MKTKSESTLKTTQAIISELLIAILILQTSILGVFDLVPTLEYQDYELLKGNFKELIQKIDDSITPSSFAYEIAPPESAVSGVATGGNASQSFQADLFTGRASSGYAIAVPPGRSGIQPNLSLAYASSNGNSWCGLGWNLGLGSIKRSTKNGIPKYDNTDTFVVSMNGVESELVNIAGNEYRAKVESEFMKYSFNDTYWQITDKSGTTYRLGYNSDSRVTNSKGTYSWHLDKVRDIYGNYMSVTYTQDQGTAYLSQIAYTGNDIQADSPHFAVDFILESRTDSHPTYRAGDLSRMNYRLKEIQTKANGWLVRRYVLDYNYSPNTSRSLLNSVTQYGSDGTTSLPPTTFSYQENGTTITDGSDWLTGFYNYNDWVLSGDFNGDGLTDVGLDRASINDSVVFSVALSNGDSFNSPTEWMNSQYEWQDEKWHTGITGDFNGDGFTDVLAQPRHNASLNLKRREFRVILSNGSSFDTATLWHPEETITVSPCDTSRYQVVSGDFNGDGLTDVMELRYYCEDGYCSTGYRVFLSNGSQFIDDGCWTQERLVYPINDAPDYTFIAGDFNGDGLTDFSRVRRNAGNLDVAFSTGSGFLPLANWITGFGINQQHMAMDVNADGLTDAVSFNSSTGSWQVAYSDGTQFGTPQNWMSSFGANKCPLAGDYSGKSILGPGFFDAVSGTWHITDTQGTPNDLLVSVDNGVGGTTTITYAPAPHNTDLPFTVQTVESITVDDGLGNSYTTQYEFSDGFYNRSEREFRGFGYAKVIDIEGNYTQTHFLQDDTYKGRPAWQRTYDASGALYSSQESTWGYVDVYPDVRFVYLESQDNYIYNGDSNYKHTRTEYQYDEYGNPTQVTSLGDVDVSGDEQTAITEYAYNATDWLLAFPKRAYLVDDQSSKISEKFFYYDNHASPHDAPVKGKLTKQEAWLYNPLTGSGGYISSTRVYDSYGNATSSTNALGRTTSTQYDSTYHAYPIQVTNHLGHTVSSAYNPNTGQVLTSTDTNGQTSTNIYDTLGRLIKVVGPLDTEAQPAVIYSYDLGTRPIKITKSVKADYTPTPEYLMSYSFYDGLGRRIQTKIPAEDDPATGASRQVIPGTIKFDSRGQVQEKYFPYFVNESANYVTPSYSQEKVTNDYDAMGRLVRATNPNGTFRTASYNDWVATGTDENGHYKTTYSDAYGRTIKIQEHNQGAIYTTLYEYDTQGNLTQVTDNQGNITQIWYDSLGRKIKMDDPDMGIWTYEYDDLGNLITQTDAKSQVLEFDYDELNRLTRKYSGATTLAGYYYDDAVKDYCVGRLSRVEDQSGSTEFYYNQLGQEIKSTKQVYGSGTYTVERTYDALGRLETLKYPDDEIIAYTYNSSGAIETVSSQVESYITDIDYSVTGQILKITYGNGTYTDYTYDLETLRLRNIITQSQTEDIQDLTYTFDNVGNIATITDGINTASQAFVYDDLDRLTQADGGYGVFDYEYDSIGNMLNKEGVTLSYGQAGRLPHAVTQYGDTSLIYDGNGNMIQKGTKALSYDIENRLTEVDDSSLSQNQTQTITLEPGWNFFSLPVAPSSTGIANVLSSIDGEYDQVTRLNPQTGEYEHYIGNSTYDDFSTFEYGRGYQIYVTSSGNVSFSVTGTLPEETTQTLYSGWNLIGASYKDENITEILNAIDFTDLIRYNEATGTLQEYPGSFSKLEAGEAYYIKVDATQSWTISNTSRVTSFAYDGDGGRVRKIIKNQSGTTLSTTTYVGSLYETQGTSVKKHVFAGGNRICTVEPTNIYYFHTDHLGSSNIITDEDGDQVGLTENTPYGSVFKQLGEYNPKYKFTGKELDSSTDFYYYGARYYDPQIGRFISADTIVPEPLSSQALNRYSYCGDNPINYTDPTGHFKFKDILTTIASVVVAITCPALLPAMHAINIGISAYTATTTGSITGFLGGLAGGAVFGAIGKSFAISFGADLGKGAFNFIGGAAIGAVEFGTAGFGAGFAGGLASGASTRDAFKLGKKGAILGSASGAVIEGSYMAGWQNKLHGASRREIYEKGIKRLNSLSVKTNDKTTAIIGSRPVKKYGAKWGRHRYARGRIGHFEMGPDEATNLIEINGENSYDATMDYLTNHKSKVIEATVVVSESGFNRAAGYYKAAWEGFAYKFNNCNSNYAVNTVIYGAGANVPENLGYSPGFPDNVN